MEARTMRALPSAMIHGPARLVVAALLLAVACAPAQPRPSSGTAPSSGAPAASNTQAGGSSQSSGPRRVTEVLGSEIVSISPYGDSASPTYGMWMHVFEPLIAYNEQTGENEPLLATSWSNPDANTWEFKLRQGVKFHDGSDFTADDVVHSYKRMRDDPDSKQRSTFKNVDEVRAVDPSTVRVHTKEPDAALIFRLNNRMITSKTVFDQYGSGAEADKHPIGTGPWIFKEYVPGQRVVMEKNSSYWGAERKATFDELIVRFMKEPQAAVTALLNGEVDVIPNVPPQLVDQVANSGKTHISSAPGTRLMFLGMNSANKPWDNVKLRQAVNYAIDKEGIVKGVLNGRASVLKTPIGPGMYAYDPNLQPQYTYDPAKAKQLLAEAGYPNGLEVELQSPSGRYLKDKEIAEAIVSMLGQVGIRARLVTPEWGKIWPDIQAGRVPFYLLGRGAVEDPSEYLEQYFMTGITPRINFSDSQVDSYLLAQQSEFDAPKRVELLHKAMSRIMDLAPMVFLFQYEDTYGVSNRMDFKARGDEYVYAWDMKLK
jgi:peptide/nickel transport system substrate-binding protein